MQIRVAQAHAGPILRRRRGTRWSAAVLGLVMTFVAGSAAAQTTTSGRSLALTVALGSQGEFSYVEAGVVLPKIGEHLSLELKARAMSCLSWVPVLDPTLDPSAFHPVAVGGVVSVGGTSPMFRDLFRAYGAAELFVGYTFTPYDSAIHGVANLIGPNVTYAVFGSFGVELFTGTHTSVFIDSGGGFKNFLVDRARKTDPYVVAASWIGSGFGIRMGSKIYM